MAICIRTYLAAQFPPGIYNRSELDEPALNPKEPVEKIESVEDAPHKESAD